MSQHEVNMRSPGDNLEPTWPKMRPYPRTRAARWLDDTLDQPVIDAKWPDDTLNQPVIGAEMAG